MDEFILIFRHQDGGKIASPEQMQVWMKQTMDWIATITAKNKFVGRERIAFPGCQGGASQSGSDQRSFWGNQRNDRRVYYCKSGFSGRSCGIRKRLSCITRGWEYG